MTISFSLPVFAQESKSNIHSSGGSGIPEVWGEATNGLQPDILVEKLGTDWQIDIELYARTNFAKNTWHKITNRFGSKLQLWLTNGMELQSTNPSVLAAMNLPEITTVSNIMHGVRPLHTRGLQWWPVAGRGVVDGESYPTTGFNLKSAFDISPTNDYVLQITPLLYEVETNEVTAHLVEFPPIKMKLMSNGDVRKEEN
jgi:hypothetical protein